MIQSGGGARLFGIELIGISAENGRKLLVSLVCIVVAWALAKLLRLVAKLLMGERRDVRARFWSEQAVHIVMTVVMLVLLVSVWFDDPGRLAAPAGLLTAGLAVALQRVITAIAGYFVILFNGVFSVGDRISMGGVRGDVIALGYTRTRIMEMGEPASVQSDEKAPPTWVTARQYTGRIVTVTNDKVFDEPVYNYTHEFPYIWEEMRIPVRYEADFGRAEQILLDAAARHTVKLQEIGKDALDELQRRYVVDRIALEPRVYWRITDNWLELAVRFIARDHGVRELKDAMSRDILREFRAAGIDVASATYEITTVPPLEVRGATVAPDGGPST
ncbi:MAG TPA: mechanosensitive ion channel domain-containing protein [Longimicrobiaceae bacterium]|nr:mechanosensitive ion channel domain-containing protein [Longimicrobiaceae bacterium]